MAESSNEIFKAEVSDTTKPEFPQTPPEASEYIPAPNNTSNEERAIRSLRDQISAQVPPTINPEEQATSKVKIPPEQNNKHPHSLREKIGKFVYVLSLMPAILNQFASIYPQKVNGEWHWVVRPGAKIEMDPRQEGIRDDNKYFDQFLELKQNGVKLIDRLYLPNGEIPAITRKGLGFQYLNHHRIFGAQQAGIPIIVQIVDYPSFN